MKMLKNIFSEVYYQKPTDNIYFIWLYILFFFILHLIIYTTSFFSHHVIMEQH